MLLGGGSRHLPALFQWPSKGGPPTAFLGGFLAGSSTRIAVEHAPDTVKTHMQRHGLPFATACKHILKKNGCRGFFKGLPAPAIASGLETALLFGPYTKAIEHLAPGIPTPELPIPIVLSAGGFAGIVASFILTPFEHVKIKAQLSETNRSSVSRERMSDIRSRVESFSLSTW